MSKLGDQIKDLMWFVYASGALKPNPKGLKALCEELLHMSMQRTGGEQGKEGDIPFRRMDVITTEIAIEACCLATSGWLDGIEDHKQATYKAMWDGIKRYVEILNDDFAYSPHKEVLRMVLETMEKMEGKEE